MKKIKKYIKNSFKPRSITIYGDDYSKNYELGHGKQITIAILSVVCFLFLSYTLASYFVNKSVIVYKNRQIKELKNKQIFLTSSIIPRMEALISLKKQEEEYTQKVSSAKINKSNRDIYLSLLDNLNNKEKDLYADVSTVIKQANNVKYSTINSKLNFAGSNSSNESSDVLKANNAVLVNTIKILKKEFSISIKKNNKLLAKQIKDQEKIIKFSSPLLLAMAKNRSAKKIAETSIGGAYDDTLPVNNIVKSVQENLYSLKHKKQYYKILKDINSHIPHIAPLPPSTYRISSRFGMRTDPFTKRQHMHAGMDLAAVEGTKIYAPTGGVIKTAGHVRGYGNLIEITHSQRYHISSRYGHLSKILVRRGQLVKKGELIALVGSTGRSTGPHLHFEILLNERQFNPCKSLYNSLDSAINAKYYKYKREKNPRAKNYRFKVCRK